MLSLNDEQSKQRAFQDYEFVAALYDAPYGKYPAIAEIANFDLGEAIIKVADQALTQNDKAKAATLLQKAQAILGIWKANAERNRSIASQSETMNNFEAQEKKGARFGR